MNRWLETNSVPLLWLVLAAIVVPATVSAQTSENEMLVERVENGFALVPDVKFTEVDGDFANLAGAYGGWIHDRNLLIGAGAYFLTNGSRNAELWYGGGVLEWFTSPTRPVQLSVRGLVGGGSGTLRTELDVPARRFSSFDRRGGFGFRGAGPGDPRDGTTVQAVVALRQVFLVAEPQANVVFRFTDWFRLGVGGSYRAIAGASLLGERLRGPSASVSFQLGRF